MSNGVGHLPHNGNQNQPIQPLSDAEEQLLREEFDTVLLSAGSHTNQRVLHLPPVGHDGVVLCEELRQVPAAAEFTEKDIAVFPPRSKQVCKYCARVWRTELVAYSTRTSSGKAYHSYTGCPQRRALDSPRIVSQDHERARLWLGECETCCEHRTGEFESGQSSPDMCARCGSEVYRWPSHLPCNGGDSSE